MREGHYGIPYTLNYQGITPAYAGRTWCKLERSCRNGDHPRLCGKDAINLFEREMIAGSPPLMREGLRCRGSSGYVCGITPAYAGRT